MTWKEMIQRRSEKEFCQLNCFDLKISVDIYQMAVVHALSNLSQLERSAITLRFLEPRPIARVADRLGMTWDGADELIDRAVEKFRRTISISRFAYLGETT